MKVRFLPPEEFGRLGGTPWAGIKPAPLTELLVVEDDDGQIIGTWSEVVLPHLEGFWVHPDHQGKAAVAKLLLSHMFRHLQDAGVSTVLTHAPGDHVEGFLVRLGGQPLPGRAVRLDIPAKA